MARIARFAVSGLPHHVTQRGNRRERVFFCDDDYELYRDLLASSAAGGRRLLGLLPDAQPRPPHVIAISGRFVATASRTAPPSASPSLSRVSSTSVEPESWIPANHTATAAIRKIRTSGTNPRPENTPRLYRSDRRAALDQVGGPGRADTRWG